MNRRRFINNSVLLATGGFLSGTVRSDAAIFSKKILVLGGRNFIGPAIVNEALRQGYSVTLFNRGVTNSDLFPELPFIKGDRTLPVEEGMRNLSDKNWDVVIDTWPQEPGLVEKSSQFFKNRTKHYVFVSTAAVYNPSGELKTTEDAELRDPTLPNYGNKKVACENKVREVFGSACTIIRPGIIAGYRNPSFTLRYWLIRLSKNKEVLAPDLGEDNVQFIDVKDLAGFIVKSITAGYSGAYNAVLYPALSFKDFLAKCKIALKTNCELTWVSKNFLLANDIKPFTDIPMWAPQNGLHKQLSAEKAIADGLTFRRMEDTINDELTWFNRNFPKDYKLGISPSDYSGMTEERESGLLKKWKK